MSNRAPTFSAWWRVNGQVLGPVVRAISNDSVPLGHLGNHVAVGGKELVDHVPNLLKI